MNNPPPDSRPTHLYTPLFCEENIWQLAHALIAGGVPATALQVLLISNAQQQVALFNQRNGAELGHVVWDYHVVLRQNDEGGDRIYDFDSLLPFPCRSHDYLGATFGLQGELHERLRATLRLVPAAQFLHRFHSDRRHMIGVVGEGEFPPWPAITPGHDDIITLDDYRDMRRAPDDDSRLLPVERFVSSELNGMPVTQTENGQG
jgi:hypothetical protein